MNTLSVIALIALFIYIVAAFYVFITDPSDIMNRFPAGKPAPLHADITRNNHYPGRMRKLNFNNFYKKFFVKPSIAIVLLFLHQSVAFTQNPDIPKDIDSCQLTQFVEVLEDKNNTISIEDIANGRVKFSGISNASINYGFTSSVIWIKIPSIVFNSGDCRLLAIENPQIDAAEIYEIDSSKNYQIKSRGQYIPYRYPLFFLKLDKSTKNSIYFRFKTEDNMRLPIYLYTIKGFIQNESITILIMAVVYGIFLGLFFYNLFIYFSIKDTTYIYYLLYIISFFLYQITVDGFISLIIKDNINFKALTNPAFFTCLLNISVILFTKSYLNTPILLPLINKAINTFLFITIGVGSGIVLLPDITELLKIGGFLEISLIVLLLSSSLILAFKKNRTSYYYLASWFFLLFFGIVTQLRTSGFLGSNIITQYGIPIGASIQVILWSLGIGDRINTIRFEKEKIYYENINLLKLDRIKSNFFANISHEIRTPLTLILTPVEALLYKEKIVIPDRKFFESIYSNALRLLGLINNLLDFSKLDAGSPELVLSEINIIKLIQNHMDSIMSVCEVKKIEMRMEYHSNEMTILADPDKIDKIIANLFSNAIKFTNRSGSITVAIYNENINDSEFCVITITDTGIGIPQAHMENIFDRFSQVDLNSSRRYEGTGIGLALVKEYVTLHNGTLTVESRHIDLYPDTHGSVFTVKIPSMKGNPSPDGTASPAKSPYRDRQEYTRQFIGLCDADSVQTDYPPETKHTNPDTENSEYTILVVEDTPGMHALLYDILKNDYNIIRANNGEEALSLLESAESLPDLILSDVMMPQMDGNEFTRLVRSDTRFEGIPVILLTARAELDMKLEGFETGATDYIIKPFNSRELSARIRSQLELKTLRDRLLRTNRQLYARLADTGRMHNTISDSSEKKINDVMEFINQNFTADISRDGIASAVGMNPDHLSRVFNRVTGKRIDAYINELRINMAKQELAETDKQIIVIAMDAGFENLRTFNRIFRESQGVTPKEFREKRKACSPDV